MQQFILHVSLYFLKGLAKKNKKESQVELSINIASKQAYTCEFTERDFTQLNRISYALNSSVTMTQLYYISCLHKRA